MTLLVVTLIEVKSISKVLEKLSITELWLRKVFPGVLYVNSNIPEERLRMMLSKKEIFELPEGRADIYRRNMVSRYLIRPHDKMFEHFCCALFIKRY